MQLTIKNHIFLDGGQEEIITEKFPCQRRESSDKTLVSYENEENEKVLLAFNAAGLTMTRFMADGPQAMRFLAGQETLMTYAGLGQLQLRTDKYSLTTDRLSVSYQLLQNERPIAHYRLEINFDYGN